jgi:hypothetical protein
VSGEFGVYDARHELPHPPSGHPQWQESVLFAWRDERARIGGFFRSGHEPARGTRNVTWAVFTDDGERFRQHEEGVPLRNSDQLADGFGSGPEVWVRYSDHLEHRATLPDCEVALDFHDFHPRFRLPPLGRPEESDATHGHFEVSGSVRGSVRMCGRTHQVNGLFHRDHSWGPRDRAAILSHRWMVGTVGPDACFQLMTLLTRTGARG